jgi:hypothetical protein
MKSQYGKKIGKPPNSFTTVLESEREETPMPILTPPSVKLNNSGSFELLPARRHTRTGAVAGSLESFASTPHTMDSETPSSPQFRMAKIQVLAEDIRQWLVEDDSMLGALQLTFDKEQLKTVFPWRIESHPSDNGSGKDLFAFNQDYLSHLASVMTLSSNTLNEFLQAAGSERSFSYGSSKYYNGQTFEEVLYRNWPAHTIALSLEKRLLERIATAHWAISFFMANAEFMPRPASPAFTDISIFAQRVTNVLASNKPTITSPRQEDTAWASELEESLQASYHQTTYEPFLERPLASTSNNPLAWAMSRARSKPLPNAAENPVEGNEADDEEERHTLRCSRSSQQLPRHSSASHCASQSNADSPQACRNLPNDNLSSSPSSSSGSLSCSWGTGIPYTRGPQGQKGPPGPPGPHSQRGLQGEEGPSGSMMHGTPRMTGLWFKEKLKASEFPPFDGTNKMYGTCVRILYIDVCWHQREDIFTFLLVFTSRRKYTPLQRTDVWIR